MANPSTFHFKLLSPNKKWIEGDVSKIAVATETGMLEILPGHASLVGIIDFSRLTVTVNGTTDSYFVRTGTLVVEQNATEVRLLANDVQPEQEVTVQSLQEYLAFLEKRLEQKDSLTAYQLKFIGEEKITIQKSIQVVAREKK